MPTCMLCNLTHMGFPLFRLWHSSYEIVLWADALLCIVPRFAQRRHCVRPYVCLSVCDKSQHCKNGETGLKILWRAYRTTMLSSRGKRGLEAKIFGLCFVASGLGLDLVLMQCWPRSHEGCSCGLIVCQSSKSRHCVTSSSDRKLLFAL